MKLKTITLGLVTLATLGTASAFAAPPDVAQKQLEVRGVLDSFHLDLAGDSATFTPQGRRDMVMFTGKDHDSVVNELKTAWKQRKALKNGYVVAGWAHLVQSDSYTFTMKAPDNERLVAEVFKDPQGARIHIWGRARNPNTAETRGVRSDLPRRFQPVGGDSIQK